MGDLSHDDAGILLGHYAVTTGLCCDVYLDGIKTETCVFSADPRQRVR